MPPRAAAALAAPTLADVDAKLALACSGPEGIEDCAPANFSKTFAAELPALEEHRAELEARWLAALREGRDYRAAYGLAWLGGVRALPELRRLLLADRALYGFPRSRSATLNRRRPTRCCRNTGR